MPPPLYMKKHYVKVMRDGKIISDALIPADSSSEAVKKALCGEGIDLDRVEPDGHYTVSSGEVMASSFGDEFNLSASYSGSDTPTMDGYLHAGKPVDTETYPGVALWPEFRDALKKFVDEQSIQPVDVDYSSLGIPRDLLGIRQPEHVNCRSTINSVNKTLHFEHECLVCDAITHHDIKVEVVSGAVEYHHTCPICRVDHTSWINVE